MFRSGFGLRVSFRHPITARLTAACAAAVIPVIAAWAVPASATAVNDGPSAVPSNPIGTLQGTFSVDGNGAATYQIPLEVPPGTGHVQPDLSLTYNSRRDNGYLGMGWALNGIESIARCNATELPDGFTAPVSYDSKDRFCIGSLKLIAVDGTYGADGTEYRTVRDNWTRFVSHGSCGQGPCWFSAQNKDGAVLRFGFTTGSNGSRILATGRSDGAVRVWSADRFTDNNGNYTEVTYANDVLLGEYYPVKVAYTGNERTGLAPQRSIEFLYERRQDRVTGYAGGSPYQYLHRLTNIKTYVGRSLVKNTVVSYAYGKATARSRVSSIQECFTDQVAEASCYPATAFTVSDPALGLSEGPVKRSSHGTANTLTLTSMDVDGDGITDLVQSWKSSGKLDFVIFFGSSQGLGPGVPQSTGVTAGDLGVIGMDVTGNGLGDLVMPVAGGGKLTLHAFLSQGRSFGPDVTTATGQDAAKLAFLPMDVDADGRLDLVQVADRGGKVAFVLYPSKGDGHFDSATTSPTAQSTDHHGFFPMDVDGDGRSDVVQPQSAGGQLKLLIYLSTGTGLEYFDSVGTGRDPAQPEFAIGDVNGDHKGDVVLLESQGDSVEIIPFLGTGTGFKQAVSTSAPGGDASKEFISADLNADGRADMVQSLDSDGKLHLVPYYSLGDRFEQGTHFETTQKIDTLGLEVMDLDGDGKQDVLDPEDDGGDLDLALFVNTEGQPDLTTRLVNGLGGEVRVTYAPMTDDQIYARGRGAQYPVRDTQSTMPLVASYVNTDGRGAEYEFKYRYEQGRVGYLGMGWLGFRYVTMTDRADGRFSVVTYDQTWPQNGIVVESSAHDPHGVKLTGTVLTYENIASNLPRHVHQIVRTSEVMSHYDVESGGALIYKLKKEYAYDGHANVELISDLGQVGIPEDDRFICVRYSNDETHWRLGYPRQDKMTRTKAACKSFLTAPTPTWNAATDLRWKRNDYDARMNLVANGEYDDSHSVWLTAAFQVDDYGNRTGITDAAGNLTTIAYETSYHTFPATITSPQAPSGFSLTDTYEYQASFGSLVRHTDANGNVFRSTFDGFGRLVDRYGPDPSKVEKRLSHNSWESDGHGTFVRTSIRPEWSAGDDPATWFWEKSYFDGLMREYRTEERGIDADHGVVSQIRFDRVGRVAGTSVPHFASESPEWEATTYDVYNRPLTATEPDGTVDKLEYRLGGLKIYRTEAFGTPEARTEIDQVNAHGLVTSRIMANSEVYRYTYSLLGQILRIEALPEERTVTFTYDSLGRLRSMTSPDSGVRSFHFDTKGRMTGFTDADGNSVSYTHDKLGRIVQVDRHTAQGDDTVYYCYDGAKSTGGNPCMTGSVSNGRGRLTGVGMKGVPLGAYTFRLGYDAYAQTQTVRMDLGGRSFSYGRDHNPLGQVSVEHYADGSQLTMAYHTGSRKLESQSLKPAGGGQAVTYTRYADYNAYGVPLNVSYKNGVTIERSFYRNDVATGKIKTLSASSGQTTLYSREIHWNSLDLVTALVDPAEGSEDQHFSYDRDKMGFLTRATGPWGTESYAYDKVGNRTEKNSEVYTYPPKSDRLSSITGGSQFAWYGNGTLKTAQAGGKTWSFTYDAENRLVKAERDGVKQPGYFLYDFAGNRVFHQPIGETTRIYTVASDYEVTDYGGGKVLHTKYIEGMFGKAVAITTAETGTNLGAHLRHHEDRMAARLYRGSPDLRGRLLAGAYGLRSVLSRPGLLGRLGLTLWGLLSAAALAAALLAGSARARRRRQAADRQDVAFDTLFARRRPLFAGLAPLLAGVLLFHGTAPAFAKKPWTPGANGAGNPTPGILYFVHDLVGSTVSVTDPAGVETAAVTYLPFGTVDSSSSSGTDDFRPKFTGREFDYDTRLYNFLGRDYDPSTGRFPTPDPAAQYINPYLYVSDSPASLVDPNGEFVFLLAIVVGAVIGAYMGAAAVNHDYNPAHWDWKSGKTYAGLLGGAVIGAVGGAVVEVAASAGVAAGIAGSVLVGAGENAAYTAMGGGSPKEILISAAEGAVFGGVFGAAGTALGKVAARFGRRGTSALTEASGSAERRLARGLRSACSSFTAGQAVLKADGSFESIEDLAVGEWVRGYDQEVDRGGDFDVAATVRGETREVTRITTASGSVVEATPGHLVRAHGMGWIRADQLDADLSLTDPEGRPVDLRSVETVPLPEDRPVFNISVDTAHSYYVSEDRVLVKNVRGACLLAKGLRRPSWRKSVKEAVFDRQRIRSGQQEGLIKSAVSEEVFSQFEKVQIGVGGKNPRWISIWQLDHKIPYRYLLRAADDTKQIITWKNMIDISNYEPNLRYMLMAENTSHAFEPTEAAGREGAKQIFETLGFWLE